MFQRGSPDVVGQLLEDSRQRLRGAHYHSREYCGPLIVDESMQLDFDAAITIFRATSGVVVTIINSRHSAWGTTSASRHRRYRRAPGRQRALEPGEPLDR